MIDPSIIGWLAAGLTLLAFCMRSMLWLRLSALAANVCFITYGALEGLAPVLVLHLLLLPCNLVRLQQLRAGGSLAGSLLRPAPIRAGARLARRRTPAPSPACGGRDWLLPPVPCPEGQAAPFRLHSPPAAGRAERRQ